MGLERIAVHISLCFAVGASLGWIVLMAQPEGWIKKQSTIYSIDCGLHQVKFSQGVAVTMASAVVSMASQKAGDWINNLGPYGEYDMQEWTQRMCSLKVLDLVGVSSKDVCSIWQAVHMASMVLTFLAGIGLFFLLTGVAMLCYWFFVKPRAVLRSWTRAMLTLGVLLLTVGNIQYALIAASVERMPPTKGGTTVGPNVMYAFMLCFFALAPLLISFLCLNETAEEARNEQISAQKRFLREQAKYGATANEGPAMVPLGGNFWAGPADGCSTGPYGQMESYGGMEPFGAPYQVVPPAQPTVGFALPPVGGPAVRFAEGQEGYSMDYDGPSELRRGKTGAMPSLPRGEV